MIFLTYMFAAFAALFFPLYWFAPSPAVRKAVMVLGCVCFHIAFAGPAGVLPIVVLGALVYGLGRIGTRWSCIAGILLSVAALVGYKYAIFLIESLSSHLLTATGRSGLAAWMTEVLPMAPPLAISFFVFEFVHYLTEVMSGSPPIARLGDFVSFTIFWPSLVAGPIKRYQQFLPACASGLAGVSPTDAASGAARVAIGAAKKILADNLTAVIAFHAGHFPALPLSQRWFVLGALAMRILLDFSGYSDMAIGFARMMGIVLPENFDWPYLATSIGGFWRRWHISLSSWIRDYVYRPLGGGRYGICRKVLNGLFAFALCGLWHGAAWNFVLWGLYHGVGLAAHGAWAAYLGGRHRGPGPITGRLLGALGWATTQLFVAFGWLLFFYPPDQAWVMARQLLGGS